MAGFTEAQLVSNRAVVLLYGGSEADRREWATEAATHLEGGRGLFEARDDAALSHALKAPAGVVYVPDAQVLSAPVQRELVRVLKQKEERPKFVLGLPVGPDTAWNKGLMRDDLHYALQRVKVDLGNAELKAALKKRRAKAGKMK